MALEVDKSKYCSVMHGDPYPPCYYAKWHCEDCKRRYLDGLHTQMLLDSYFQRRKLEKRLQSARENLDKFPPHE